VYKLYHRILLTENACSHRPIPAHGDLSCTPQVNGIQCAPSCKRGYNFAISPSDSYYCDYMIGEWMPGNRWPVKDCSGILNISLK